MNIQSALQVFDSRMAKNFLEIAALTSCHAEATVYRASSLSSLLSATLRTVFCMNARSKTELAEIERHGKERRAS